MKYSYKFWQSVYVFLKLCLFQSSLGSLLSSTPHVRNLFLFKNTLVAHARIQRGGGGGVRGPDPHPEKS